MEVKWSNQPNETECTWSMGVCVCGGGGGGVVIDSCYDLN